MLRFFRKIRQRLFQEGKVSRYIGYAVGEILLIMIGIFLALQLNIWNEERKEAALANQYMERLMADIEGDIQQLTFSKEFAEYRIQFIDLLTRIAETPELAREHPAELLMAVRKAGFATTNPLTKDTFEELRSSGYLRLLDNELKTMLFGFYKIDERRRQYRAFNDLVAIEYFKLAKGILTNEQALWVQKAMPTGAVSLKHYAGIPSLEYDEQLAVEAAHRLANNQAFLDWLPEVRNMNDSVINNHNGRIKDINELLEFMKSKQKK